ncbi:HEAT repeat domain-containing protein [Leptospira yasudae]|uniref:HEAT repeat domain-containing protein n=1 Tax=Leptospira yasudae TaxID=2202201 RepID=A0A6N4R0L9_9LEPT|nr:HEAT repeat domain-containing protein [Leptospira yasudae]TGL77056.1 HEAT repeat domain-containing protein [Leptospira yasudae]TGL83889.1 HEAT repeat domain-containing protein [Leptospira yasudae]TGL89907.1 HEAT repeat domain-containing protein [Leptospira yasudae]
MFKNISISIILSSIFTLPLFSSDKAVEYADRAYFEQIRKLETGSYEEKVDAADYLKFVNNRLAVRPLLNALRGNPKSPKSLENHPYLKFTVAQALAVMDQEVAIKPTIEEYKKLEPTILEKDEPYFTSKDDYTMVIAVGEILRTIGSYPYAKESEDVLVNALSHPNYYIRASAADGLKYMNRKETVNFLVSTLEKEKNDFTKAALLNSIVNIMKVADKSFYSLCDMLKSENPSVRYRVSMALGEVDLKAAEFYLRQALLIEDKQNVRDQIRKDLSTVLGFKLPTISVIFAE